MTTKTKTQNGQGKTKFYSPKRLALACGQRKPEGFFGVDIVPLAGVDLALDLLTFPWPIRSNSVQELEAHHWVEHIPHRMPGWEKDGWWMFFDEVYRICKRDATCHFVHPYSKSDRAFWDPTHERFINETTWWYLNRDWRLQQGLDHYPTDVHFEIIGMDGMGIPDHISTRHHEAVEFAKTHYMNVIADLSVRLRVSK